jgi:hypothetical protein
MIPAIASVRQRATSRSPMRIIEPCVLLALVLTAAAGCATKGDVAAIRADIAEARLDVAQVQAKTNVISYIVENLGPDCPPPTCEEQLWKLTTVLTWLWIDRLRAEPDQMNHPRPGVYTFILDHNQSWQPDTLPPLPDPPAPPHRFRVVPTQCSELQPKMDELRDWGLAVRQWMVDHELRHPMGTQVPAFPVGATGQLTLDAFLDWWWDGAYKWFADHGTSVPDNTPPPPPDPLGEG